MAEIILSADETLESQLQAILALATELEHGHSQVVMAPRATTADTALPHGVTVTVPDELAEAYAEQRQAAAAEAERATPRKRAARTAKAAEDKTPVDPAKNDSSGDGEKPKE